VVCALLFCTNHAKGFIRLKHLLELPFHTLLQASLLLIALNNELILQMILCLERKSLFCRSSLRAFLELPIAASSRAFCSSLQAPLF